MNLDCYARPGTPFGAKGPFYSADIGHRGQDYYASAGSPVVAYEDMVIEYVGNTTGLGTVVGARLARDGKHAGWAHLRNVRPFLNGWIAAGTQFAEVAGAGDSPGTLWDGAHIHTTLTPASSSSSAAANGNAPLEDPAPRIASARSGTANAGQQISLEDDMTPEQQKTLDDIHWMLSERIRPQLNELADPVGKGSVHKKLDQLLWVTNDGTSGIRAMLARVLKKLGI